MIRAVALVGASLLLVGCSATGMDRFGSGRTSSLTPAPVGQVQSQGLSPLVPDATYQQSGVGQQPINNAMGAEAELQQGQSTVAMTAPANAANLSRTDLLGAWTLASGAEQCRLNVNLTTWTGGYRASTRGCQSSDLQRINAWRLDGKQVVLLAEDGSSVMARLYSTSAGRFDGLAEMDGRAVSFFR